MSKDYIYIASAIVEGDGKLFIQSSVVDKIEPISYILKEETSMIKNMYLVVRGYKN